MVHMIAHKALHRLRANFATNVVVQSGLNYAKTRILVADVFRLISCRCYLNSPNSGTFKSKPSPYWFVTSLTAQEQNNKNFPHSAKSIILSKKLKSMATKNKSAEGFKSEAGGHGQQKFDFFLVLDFEATCDDKKQPDPQEIIEFPVLKVNAKTGQVDATFHQYVSPQYHPQLTPFCTQLTGIIQDMVTDQPNLPDVLQSFDEWMLQEGLLEPDCQSIFVTCGDWDLKTMLPKQCAVLDLAPKRYFSKWINIKKSFADVTSTFPKGLMYMLNHLGLKHVGRHHSGIDDCRNIANILVALMKQGYLFKENGRS